MYHISERMPRTRHVARIGEMSNANQILVEKPEEKRVLGRLGVHDNDNIGDRCGLDSAGSGYSLVDTVMKLQVPQHAGNCCLRCAPTAGVSTQRTARVPNRCAAALRLPRNFGTALYF
jgi:hypothetical protein